MFNLFSLFIIGIIIAMILLFVYILVSTNNKIKNAGEPIDIDAFINALGGKKNIETIDVVGSKIKVVLKDVSLLQAEEIKKLGSSGIVISDQKVMIIFGKLSSTIVDLVNKK